MSGEGLVPSRVRSPSALLRAGFRFAQDDKSLLTTTHLYTTNIYDDW